ncbi:MAG: hypothetical protein VKK43_05675, partial [Synechococcaceae cyanobacterium]|nr:hypothetical protein [Synechococcaceae cyanobacterium]
MSLTLLVTAVLPLLTPASSPARPPASASALPQPRGPRVGVWLTNSPSPLYYDAARIEQAVDQLAQAGFNTLYPNVWSR